MARDTVEEYIRSVHGRQLEYQLKLLKASQKRKGRKKPLPIESLGMRKCVEARPPMVVNRERVGDVEADFIVSGKTGSGRLLTVVNCKIGVGFIRKILPVIIANMKQAFLDVKAVYPELASVTTDNGLTVALPRTTGGTAWCLCLLL